MIENKNKPSIVCLSQDPDSIFSYGLQVSYLIQSTKHLYDWHVISSQYSSGNPFERDGYTKWAHEGPEARCTRTLEKVVEIADPFCVFSMGDIHHHEQIPLGKPLQVPWVSWFPWDNHDAAACVRNAGRVNAPEIKVTMSDFSENFLKRYGIEVEEKIYNIVDTNIFKPVQGVRKAMNNRNPILRDKKVLLFVGRPNWRKNLEDLLGSFERMLRKRNDLILYLHVNLEDNAQGSPNISKLLHSLILNKHVIITEVKDFKLGVPKKRMCNLYNLADLYVTTHAGEGFGLPIAEAMACETPFVATDCTTTPEFAGNGSRGLAAKVDVNMLDRGVIRPRVDIEDFVDKCLWILDQPDKIKEMGINGRKHVVENYSLEAVIPKWINLFNKLNTPRCHTTREIEIDWKEMGMMK